MVVSIVNLIQIHRKKRLEGNKVSNRILEEVL